MITRFNGERINNSDELIAAIKGADAGERVSIRYEHFGRPGMTEAKLISKNNAASCCSAPPSGCSTCYVRRHPRW